MTDDEFNILLILIVLLSASVCKELYGLYTKFTRIHHETYFVMMGDPECCSINDLNSNRNCKKYCLGRLLLRIINRINSAQSSICIAMYNFTNHKIADSVLRAHRRGVKVRIITDKSMSENKENKTQAKRLKDAGKLNSLNPLQIQKHFIHLHMHAIFCKGISVRISGEADKLMHHKFCLIDGTSAKGALITGSLNWTYTVCFLNFQII